MQAIVMGDLHGNIQFYKGVRDNFSEPIVLTGDLLDSFIYTRTEQLSLLEEVLKDVESGRTKCVMGNHELGYLYPHMQCSGFSSSFGAQIIHLKNKMHRLLAPFIYDDADELLITHAGVSKNFLNACAPDGVFYMGEWLTKEARDPDGPLYNIPYSRGGASQFGGIFWCDYFEDFSPVEDLHQIFGHTVCQEITWKNHAKTYNFNLDCIDRTRQVLKVQDGLKFEVLTLDQNFKTKEKVPIIFDNFTERLLC